MNGEKNIEVENMGIERIIEILETEKECVIKNINGCDGDCGNCDLVLEDEEILTAYTLAISILKNVHGDRKVISIIGEQNEFTIL